MRDDSVQGAWRWLRWWFRLWRGEDEEEESNDRGGSNFDCDVEGGIDGGGGGASEDRRCGLISMQGAVATVARQWRVGDGGIDARDGGRVLG
ncbi:hypothetical protein U1Q18_033942 [Sarracenia purpurea var. burkii]